MKKIISLVLFSFLLSGCSFFLTHKMDIEQGNIITDEQVSRLHAGMSETEVKDIMGTPMLSNIFTPNRIEYVYTLQSGHNAMQEKRITCIFQNGRLRDVLRS